MNDKNLFKNIGIGVLVKPLSMILSLVYVPLAITYLGDARYGIWATISSFTQWFSMFDIGIGYGMRNKLAASFAVGDMKKSGEITSTAYIVISRISVCLFLAFTVISVIVDLPKVMNIEAENDNVRLALWITVLFVCLNFVLSLSNTIAYAIQKAAVASVAGVAVQALNTLFIVVCKKLIAPDMVVVALTLGASGAIINAIVNVILFGKYRYLAPRKRNYRKSEVKDITSIGFLLFIGQIGSLVMNSTDNLLISRLFNPADVTPYSTAYKMFLVFIQIQGIIILPMWSAFTSAETRGEYQWIRNKFKRMQQIAVLLSLGVIVLLIVIKPVSRIWIGRDLNYPETMLIVMACYFIVYLFSSNYASFLCGTNDLKIYSVNALVAAIANIPLSILFAKTMRMGLTGIILGTLVSQVPGLFMLGHATHKHMKMYNMDKAANSNE